MARLMAEPALASVRLQRPAPISELERAPAQVQVVQEVVGDIDDFLRDIPFFEKHLDFRALAKGLRDHNHSAEAAGLVLQAFATISNKDNRRDAARAAIGPILAVMDAHLANSPLQAVACSALSMLALNSQEVKAMMEEQQALKRILAAMDSHLEDRQVQGMGCYALMSAANSDTRAQIVKGGGIDLSFTLLQL